MKKICIVLILSILAQLMILPVGAEEMPRIFLYDDFEGIVEGRHPLYKDGYWSGDSLITNYCGYLDVVKTDSGRQLRIHSKGAGTAIGSTGPFIYAYLNDITDSIVLEADVTIETPDSQVNIWLRGATASHIIRVFNFEGGAVTCENRKICDYEINRKYHLTAVLHAKEQTIDATVDGVGVKGVRMNVPLISSLQALRFILTGNMDKGAESGFLLDNVRVYEADEVKADSVFSGTAAQLGLYDWSDLTKFMNSNITLVKSSADAAVGTKREKLSRRVYFEYNDVYAPAEFVFESLNIPYKFTASGAEIEIDGKKALLQPGRGLRLINTYLYVSLEYLSGFAGMYLSKKDNVAIFGPHLVYFNNAEQASQIERYVKGEPTAIDDDGGWYPTAEQVQADFEKTSKNTHPRVLATKDDFDRIRELIKNDADVAKWYADIKAQADYYVTQPPFTFRTTDGLRMDTSVISRFETMGMVYNVEGGEQYAKKAYEDMATIAEYETWQPNAFILLANMLTAMAIGYDWFYNSMTPEMRGKISEGMYRLGLKYALDGYRREVEPGATALETRSRLQWLNDQSNWTAVGNGGAVMGAVALYDEYPAECNEAIVNAFKSIENFYSTTEPDGGCTEGVGYWLYSRIHYVNLVAALMSGLGTDYGRYTAGGFDKSGYFPIYMQNEAGAFTFSDSDNYTVHNYLYMYFAMRNSDKGLGYYRRKELVNNLSTPTVYDILWYDSSYADAAEDMPLDGYFRNVESGSFRDTFNNDFSTFLAFHGGSNTANHAHIDSGTWNLHAHGVKWFLDLGKEPLVYNNPTGISFTSDQLYRIRAEGHNVTVFNPDASGGQTGTFAPVESFRSAESGGYAIVDLSNIYNAYVTEYKRGFMLTDNRSRAVIQDKFTAKKPSEFWWFAHTQADIEISGDGKCAVLSQDGRRLAVYLRSTDDSLKFSQMAAEPLATSPKIIGSADNSNFKKLCIHGENITELELAVSCIPIVSGESIPRDAPSMVELSKWSIKEKESKYPVIGGVKLDGEDFAEFNSKIFEYMIKLPYSKTEIPQIDAAAEEDCKILQDGYESNLHEVRKVSVINEKTGKRKNYYFTFMNLPTTDIPGNIREIRVENAYASDEPQPQYPATNVIDGDLSVESRWSALDDQWLVLDMGREYEVDRIALALMNGKERQSTFEVYTSADNRNYTQTLSSMNSRTTDGLELFRMKPTRARYVKIMFHGADISRWNSVKEVKLFERDEKYTAAENKIDISVD